MSDFAKTIEAKSDQLNSDDLISGPITIKITAVKINLNSEQQPVSISYEGDNNKPWKPSKSMRRALVMKWGDDEANFIGRSITLFRDPTITYGGEAVGGISISHMSDIQNEDRFLLTSRRGAKKAMKIERLKVKTPEEKAEDSKNRASVWVSQSKLEIKELDTAEKIQEWKTKNDKAMKSLEKYNDLSCELEDFISVSIEGLK